MSLKQVTQYQMNKHLETFKIPFQKHFSLGETEYFVGDILVAKVNHPINEMPTYWIKE